MAAAVLGFLGAVAVDGEMHGLLMPVTRGGRVVDTLPLLLVKLVYCKSLE